MTYIALRDQNNAIKKISTFQYSCSIEIVLKAIHDFISNNDNIRLESSDRLANIIYLHYYKVLLVQDVWLIALAVDEDKTNLTIEVINNRRNATINHSHEFLIDYVIDEITKEINR